MDPRQHRPTPARRRSTKAVLVALVTLLLVAVPIAAEAGMRTATVTKAGGTQYVNIRSAPNTSSSVVGRANAGQAVGLQCAVTGSAVKGPYGTTSLWYRIDGSTPTASRFVTDALLETGSNSQVTPNCGPPGMRLPFAKGYAARISQAPGGSYSHSDTYNLSAVDWAVPSGTPIYSSAAGRVYAEGWRGAGGIVALIQVGTSSACHQYAHLSRTVVNAGQQVARGQLIGYSGGSGNGSQSAYAPHLHWAGVDCASGRNSFVPWTDEAGTNYPAGATYRSLGG